MTPANRLVAALRPESTQAHRRIVLVAGTAFAASLLAGCSGMPGGVKSASASQQSIEQRLVQGDARTGAKAAKAIARAELAVQRSPEDAATRAALGNAYLAAGRFGSAATALDDAMALGDSSGRTALALALAKIGTGQHREAVALLDDWRAEIPAGDLGLALALAGETSRGVAVLADAVRSGESTPKLRQNLAYAYALDGRWSEARQMAEQDVPADQLERRLALWALSMLPDRNQDRVAALIGAPAHAVDPGQPAALALKSVPDAPQVAVAAPAPAPQVSAPAELPAASEAPGATIQANIAAQAAPVAPPARQKVAQAFAPFAALASTPARPASVPAVRRPLHVATRMAALPASGPAHYVQLGAFASEQGARRAWGIYTRRNPGLAAYRMTISPATVKGRQVWRVAAGGLGGHMAANTLCARVKSQGGACFAYSLPARAVPSPVQPGQTISGPQRARR